MPYLVVESLMTIDAFDSFRYRFEALTLAINKKYIKIKLNNIF